MRKSLRLAIMAAMVLLLAVSCKNEKQDEGLMTTFTAGQGGAKTHVDGALPGKFTVGMDGSTLRKVHFSQGNLQYVKAESKWQFAATQYETAETYSQDVGKDYANHGIQTLFGWGDVTPLRTDYQGYSWNEWGAKIGDGSTWSTLTTEEWQYLFSYGAYGNDTRRGMYRYGVTVMGKANCVVLYPDGYDKTGMVDNGDTGSFDTETEYNAATEAGIVFLPAAGARSGSSVITVGSYGYYWSSTPDIENSAWYLYFGSGLVGPDDYYVIRYYGFSVRLVCAAEN